MPDRRASGSRPPWRQIPVRNLIMAPLQGHYLNGFGQEGVKGVWRSTRSHHPRCKCNFFQHSKGWTKFWPALFHEWEDFTWDWWAQTQACTVASSQPEGPVGRIWKIVLILRPSKSSLGATQHNNAGRTLSQRLSKAYPPSLPFEHNPSEHGSCAPQPR